MGYGLGAAIGGQFGQPDRRVVLISGDGSFHMNLNELTTLASYNLPVVVLVMNNRVLGMVRQWQKVFYGRRFSATDPHRKTDLVKLAESLNEQGWVSFDILSCRRPGRAGMTHYGRLDAADRIPQWL